MLRVLQRMVIALSPMASRFFNPSTGRFEKPTVFKMWKESSKEPLIKGNHVFGIDSGKTYTLDLEKGKKVTEEANGDLRVTVTRPSNAKRKEKYPWSFSIEAIHGGLLESDDDFMYLAPESGYKPKMEMQLDPTESGWAGSVRKRFFFRTRDGQSFGSAQVEVYSIYNTHSAIEINYSINPNGSRNLQP